MLTNSVCVEKPVVPRILSVPPSLSSAGSEAVELCRDAGLHLDPWEEFVLKQSLGERADGKWSAFEVAMVVPRQNGKGSVLEARELAGLYLLDERLIIHSAHQFDTSLEAFRRLLFLIEDTPDLEKRIQRVSKSHGEEGIELKKNPKTGLRQRIRFRTRTKGGGRGFTADCLVLDESMFLPESTLGALLPTLSARPNPQVWYAASAVDQEIHEDGLALARVRERGIKGDDPALLYAEWSAPVTHPVKVSDAMARNPEVWAQANPGYQIRISHEHIEREQRSMDARTFAVERLNVGDWPRTDGLDRIVISPEDWAKCVDEKSTCQKPICLSIDVNPERSFAAIAVAGYRTDGRIHVEVIEHRRGVDWVAARVVELREKHDPRAPVLLDSAMAGSILPELTDKRVTITPVGIKDQVQACASFFDAVVQDHLRHIEQPGLTEALRAAKKRNVGDGWAWSRKDSTDICPLVASTLAAWGLTTLPRHAPEVVDLNDMYLQMKEAGEL